MTLEVLISQILSMSYTSNPTYVVHGYQLSYKKILICLDTKSGSMVNIFVPLLLQNHRSSKYFQNVK